MHLIPPWIPGAADPGDDEPTEGGQSGGCGDGDGCGRK